MSNLFAWGLRKFYDTDVEGLEEELSNLQQQVSELNIRNKSLQEKGLSDARMIQTLQEQGLADSLKIQYLQRQSGKLKNQVADLTQTNNTLLKQIAELQSENGAYKGTLNTANRNIDDLQKQVDDLSQEIEKIQQNPDDREQLLDQIEQLKREKTDFEEKYNTSCNENKTLSRELGNAKATIDNLDEQVKSLNASITNKNEQINELNSSIADKVKELEEKERKIQELSEKLKGSAGLGGKEIDTGDNSQPPISDENKIEEPYNGGTPCVKDVETGEEIMAKDFFRRPEADIFKTRSELVKAMLLNKPKYICKYCGGMVKVSGVKLVKGTPLHFMHVSEDADCKYNIPDPRETRHSGGSGVRHANPRRTMLRAELEKLLVMTPGVSNVRVGKTVKAIQHPLFGRKRPDLQVSYHGRDLVIELQLSSNYVANLTERDLFYRLEHKHVIRIFSFDKSVNSLDLKSMTSKDVYFNSHLNVFIFDDEAQEKSEEVGELYLKCNWIKAAENGDVWEYQNENASDKLGGRLIKLSDLTFEDSTYKPYYYDAEKEYYAVHEDLKKQYEQQKKDEDSIIDDLEKNWNTPKQPEVSDVDKIKEAYNIDTVINSTKSYVKGKCLGKCGLVTMDGVLRVPFEYEDIKTYHVEFNESKHSGWTKAVRDGIIDIYDADFKLKGKDIVRIEDLVGKGILKKYVKKQDGYMLWGLMDSHGNTLTNPIYSELKAWSDKILAICEGKYSILDANGKEVVKGYDFIGEPDEDGTAETIKNGRKGRINKYCKDIRTSVFDLDEGYQKVCINGKWGIEDKKGEEIISCDYDDIGSWKGQLIGINNGKLSILEKTLLIDIPLKVKYKEHGETKKLIFAVGRRIAFMNLRQQQKASKLGLKPVRMDKAYISFINLERELLYLSVKPINGVSPTAKAIVKDKDIHVGTIWNVKVIHIDDNGIVVKSDSEESTFLYKTTWGNRNKESFSIGQSLKIEKTGFDKEHNKHVWKILEVSPSETVPLT